MTMTYVISHHFQILEHGPTKFHDFPWPENTRVTVNGNSRTARYCMCLQCKPKKLYCGTGPIRFLAGWCKRRSEPGWL